MTTETQEFQTSAEFLGWAKRIVKGQYLAYHRAPVGVQTWTYGDGHVVTTEVGKRQGTWLAHLDWVLAIMKGLKGEGTVTMINDINTRGGVTLTINW